MTPHEFETPTTIDCGPEKFLCFLKKASDFDAQRLSWRFFSP